jgi:glycosyltransferase involved in cell wall biosynthesis
MFMLPETGPRTIVLFQPEIEAMGGAERSLLALCRWLYEHDIDHRLLTYKDHVGIASFASQPLQVIELQPEMRAAKKIASLRRFFAQRPVENAPLLSGYQSSMHAALAGIRGTHCLMHDTPDLFEDKARLSLSQKTRRWISNHLVGHNLRSGGRTIVTSEHLQSECRKLFRVRADIARMGGLKSAAAFQPRSVEGELKLLSVSRVEANKRIDWILRSLAELERGAHPLSSRVHWSLDVVGDGNQISTLRELATTLDIAPRVHFRGRVSDAELQQAYAEAHLFLMPAVQGYGIPAVEALSRGLPVLLHRESGVSDILLETPWATIMTGGEEGMLPGLRNAINVVIEGRQRTASPPQLPNEDQWAEHVAMLCGWLR